MEGKEVRYQMTLDGFHYYSYPYTGSPDNYNKWFDFCFMNSEENMTLAILLCFLFFLSSCSKISGKRVILRNII